MDTTRFSADRVGGLIWFVFGAAVVYGSWTMDRLENLNILPPPRRALCPACSALVSWPSRWC